MKIGIYTWVVSNNLTNATFILAFIISATFFLVGLAFPSMTLMGILLIEYFVEGESTMNRINININLMAFSIE